MNISFTPKMIISQKALNNINYLHSQCGKLEWSGMLLYKIEGSIDKLNDLEVEVEDILLCDIGSHSFTSYSHVDHYDQLEELFPNYSMFSHKKWNGTTVKKGYKVGQIHTHHHMDAFFSGTDMQELADNTVNFGLYVSLIVNWTGNYCAKGAFMAQSSSRVNLKLSDFPTNFEIVDNKQELITFDFDIDFQTPNWMKQKVAELLELKRSQEKEKLMVNKKPKFKKQEPFIFEADEEFNF
jgi:hypothetical protein